MKAFYDGFFGTLIWIVAILRAIDLKIIEFFQNAYLWLLDRTGITVGDLQTGVVIIILPFDGLKFSTVFVIVLTILVCQFRAMLQRKGQFDIININAEVQSSSWFYIILRLVFLPTFAGVAGIGGFFLGIVIYLYCVKIRKRDPDRFKKLVPAGEHSNG